MSASAHAHYRADGFRVPFLDAFVLVAPALLFIEIDSLGRLFAGEIVMAFALPFLLRLRDLPPMPTRVVLLGLLWLWSQVITDLLRGAVFSDYARGWALIGFLITNFVTLYLAVDGRTRRIKLMLAGVAVGLVLEYLVHPNVYAAGSPWKFGYGESVVVLILLAATHRLFARWSLLPAALLGVLAFVSISDGARALAGVCFLASLMLVLQRVVARRDATGRAVTFSGMLVFAAAAAIGTFGVLSLYGRLASSGSLGVQAQVAYSSGASGKYGILLSDRGEIFSSLRAIEASPILGHGSYAKDPSYYWAMVAQLHSAGYPVTAGGSAVPLIPTHSFFFGAWVDGGLLGALFWFWIAGLAVLAIAGRLRVVGELDPLLFFLGLLVLWDIAFSPFGAERRVTVAATIVFLVHVVESRRGGRAEASS